MQTTNATKRSYYKMPKGQGVTIMNETQKATVEQLAKQFIKTANNNSFFGVQATSPTFNVMPIVIS